MDIDDITKGDFAAYERVSKSGVCNMLSGDVQVLARITKAKHAAIIEHYEELCARYPDVRDLSGRA